MLTRVVTAKITQQRLRDSDIDCPIITG
eukprot:COSAG06_NODE_16178_length_1016_cov_0.703381_1_plen_27_part_10